MTSYDGGIASRFENDHLGCAILDFLISPKPQKNTKIDKKLIKMIRKTRKGYTNMKVTVRKLVFVY